MNQAFFGSRDDEAADLFPTDVMTGLPFQTGIEFGAVFVDLGHAVAGAEATDQSGGVPGGSAGKLVLFKQHDIFPAEFGQMIGDAAPDDTATDDDDFGLCGHIGMLVHTAFDA